MYLAVFIFSTVPHHIASGELFILSHSSMCQAHHKPLFISYTNICCTFLSQLKFISCLWRITIVWNCVRHFCTLFPGIFSFICGPNGEPKSECCASFFYAICFVSQYRDQRDKNKQQSQSILLVFLSICQQITHDVALDVSKALKAVSILTPFHATKNFPMIFLKIGEVLAHMHIKLLRNSCSCGKSCSVSGRQLLFAVLRVVCKSLDSVLVLNCVTKIDLQIMEKIPAVI